MQCALHVECAFYTLIGIRKPFYLQSFALLFVEIHFYTYILQSIIWNSKLIARIAKNVLIYFQWTVKKIRAADNSLQTKIWTVILSARKSKYRTLNLIEQNRWNILINIFTRTAKTNATELVPSKLSFSIQLPIFHFNFSAIFTEENHQNTRFQIIVCAVFCNA